MIGRTVGHYRILERLGGGGMGVVYKAEDTTLDRVVALKFLPDDLTRDDIARKRFLVEARAAAKLDHPNICTVFEVGETDDGQTFIAMQFVEGEPLSARIESSAMPVEVALRIAIEIARGLGAAHAAGIVHRDVKPANVILATNGEVKIVDFGVAKLAGETITGAGHMPGTLAYMAPEQIRGGDVGPPTDLWALGVVLFEMIRGRRPFRSASHQALAHAILTEEIPPAEDHANPHIDSFFRRAMAKDPAARFQSAEEMITSLGEIRDGRAGRLHIATRTAGLATALVLVLAGAGLWTWKTSSPNVGSPPSATPPAATGTSGLTPNRVVVANFENAGADDPSLQSLSRVAASRVVEAMVGIGIDAVPTTLAVPVSSVDTTEQSQRGDDAILSLARTARAGIVVTGDFELDDSTMKVHAKVVDAATRRILWVVEPGRAPRASPNEAIDAAATRVRDAVAHTLRQHDSSVHSRWLDYELRPPRYEAAVELRLARDSRNRGVLVVEGQCVHGRRAIELDPDFVAAYQIMSDCHVVRNEYTEAEPYLDRAYALRDRISRVGQLNLDAWIAFTNGQHERAAILQREAVRLAPADIGARHQLGRYLIHANRPAEAIRLFEEKDWDLLVRAEAPQWGLLHFFMLTSSLSSLGLHERELEQARHAREVYPDKGICKLMEAMALASLGRLPELDDLIDEALAQNIQLVSAGRIMMTAAGALHAAGRTEEEQIMWARAHEWFATRPQPEQAHHQPPSLAATWAGQLSIARRLTTEALANAGTSIDRVSSLGQLGVIAALKGNADEAAAISERLAAVREPHLFGGPSFQRARIAALLGQRDIALQHLRDAMSDGLFFWNVPLGVSIHRDPAFQSLRGWEPFEELIRPKG